MNPRPSLALALLGLVAAGGCRTATRVTQAPRVDLALEGGNRGYLVGAPSAEAEPRPTTREMVETTIEIPSFYRPKRSRIPVTLEPPVPEAQDADTSGAVGVALPGAAAPSARTYVVQRGDSLWSIAAKPDIYGSASQWRRIFDANRDVLKSPNRLRAGMTLKIPQGGAEDSSTTYGDEGATYRK